MGTSKSRSQDRWPTIWSPWTSRHTRVAFITADTILLSRLSAEGRQYSTLGVESVLVPITIEETSMCHRNVRLPQRAPEEILLHLSNAELISGLDPGRGFGSREIESHRARPSATGSLNIRHNHNAPGGQSELARECRSSYWSACALQGSRNHRVLTIIGAKLAAAAALRLCCCCKTMDELKHDSLCCVLPNPESWTS